MNETETVEAGARTHTPGPWTFVDMPDRRQSGYIRCTRMMAGGARGVAVARAFQDGMCSWEEYEANARLIAAAPELLEACKFFMGALDDGDLVRDTSHDHDSGWALKAAKLVADLKKASDAIAKAEGLE